MSVEKKEKTMAEWEVYEDAETIVATDAVDNRLSSTIARWMLPIIEVRDLNESECNE